MRNNIVLLPFGTNAGLLGAVFESIGKPVFPKPQPISNPAVVDAAKKPQFLLYETVLHHHLSAWCQDHMLFSDCGPIIKASSGVVGVEVQQEDTSMWIQDPSSYGLQDADWIRKATEEGMLEASTPMLYSL